MAKTFSDCSDGLRRLLLSLEPPEVNYIPPANRKDVIRNSALAGSRDKCWRAYGL
jgi:hypothetical protein